MEDITRTIRKVLTDYITEMYLNSFTKVITYLGVDSKDSLTALNSMDENIRNHVIAKTNNYQKTSAGVQEKIFQNMSHRAGAMLIC